jgi:nitrogen fixation/metabolism regulation signal transduction histidine kinase
VTLRRKFIIYLVALHVPFAALAVYVLLNQRIWLLAVEAAFAVSLAYGVHLTKGLFVAIDRIREGSRLIADADFTSRFREVGHEEMDQLIAVYNRMADSLREERVRLQEQNYFLERLLEASPLGVVTLDFDGRIAAVNPSAERMLQLPGEAVRGQKLGEIGSAFASDVDAIPRDESRVVALNSTRRVKCQRARFMDRGFPREFVMMAELTEELRRSEKAAYDKLIRVMSHEVNNTVAVATSILTSCLAFADQLRDDDREDFVTGLEAVVSRAEQLNAFMSGFADVVRIPEPKRSPCDVHALLESISQFMKAELRRRRIAWVWDVQDDLPPISMDRIQMEQVFVNVVKNAMEAIDDGGTITIRLGVRGNRSFAVVEDSGNGISPEAAAQLFTPFFTSKEYGQGVGLTIVREILSRHGFEFSLEGPPGGPTRFTIYFT